MNTGIQIEVLGTLQAGVFTPAQPGVGTVLAADRLVIGSCPGQSPSLTLKDGTVSRNHAEVFVRNGTWRIRDLDSDNGLVFFPDAVAAAPDALPQMRRERRPEAAIGALLIVAVGAVVLRLTAAPG
jgi:hypothetical protein